MKSIIKITWQDKTYGNSGETIDRYNSELECDHCHNIGSYNPIITSDSAMLANCWNCLMIGLYEQKAIEKIEVLGNDNIWGEVKEDLDEGAQLG